MKKWLALLLASLTAIGAAQPGVEPSVPSSRPVVVIIPVRDDINKPMVYLIRRGVKTAIEMKADLLLLDMDTNGGLVSSTEEIMQILTEFPGQTATYVNKKAFSAGVFISVATRQIFMAPQSVIGAAAPILLAPGGGGTQDMPGTMEAKTTSALSALVRAQAEKNGHNVDVIQAMIDKTKELKIGDELLNKEGNILTLTDQQAAKEYGEPPKALFSAGTVNSLDLVLERLGYADAEVTRLEPTGAEKLGTWLLALGPLLLVIGIAGVYIEMKTPGFGVPGVIGLVAFALYFMGGYAAGLSGWEWLVIFIFGLGLVILELFVFPGTIVIGLAGAGLMLAAIVMALVDLYPNPGPGLPKLPSFQSDPFNLPLRTMLIALAGSAVAVAILGRLLPKTSIYHTIVSETVSGGQTERDHENRKNQHIGQTGVTLSSLRPGGKAQFGEEILDVVSQGDFILPGTRVRVIGFNGNDPLVEPA